MTLPGRRVLTNAFVPPARVLVRRRSYAYWGTDHYVRNLVALEEDVFEMIVRGATRAACSANTFSGWR